ncbi:hypothetical protein Emin_0450 [Elusimicrobium minutum Pei191]|uniref:DUF4402 domain-containing protein n=1 Tax=Elusimicrobium minutum (strain Pei191) TaxID=445932 RepID=B2KBI5_ELUMP|nr:DUF4402 domain-containing protein [Elusimicrobium minutum]ACC98007.1 hypothetical protein Emin_0450 [Elusimicrobium minutum Pei191]
MKKILVMLFAFLIVSSAAFAVTGTGSAQAEIIAPLSVTGVVTLDFGKIVQPTGAEVVTLTTAGVISGATAGHVSGTQTVGEFEIIGAPNQDVTFSVADTTLTGVGPAMVLKNYTFDKALTHPLDATGNSSVKIGGELEVAANQDAGMYIGNYTVTVNY